MGSSQDNRKQLSISRRRLKNIQDHVEQVQLYVDILASYHHLLSDVWREIDEAAAVLSSPQFLRTQDAQIQADSTQMEH